MLNYFDSQNYIKTVLAPYRARLAGAETLPNVFVRYAISDQVDDSAVIAKQIELVHDFWHQQRNHVYYGELIGALSEPTEVARARDILLDPHLRLVERQRLRKESQQQSLERLDEAIAGVCAKGYCTPAELGQLMVQFEGDGCTIDTIRERIPVPLDNQPPARPRGQPMYLFRFVMLVWTLLTVLMLFAELKATSGGPSPPEGRQGILVPIERQLGPALSIPMAAFAIAGWLAVFNTEDEPCQRRVAGCPVRSYGALHKVYLTYVEPNSATAATVSLVGLLGAMLVKYVGPWYGWPFVVAVWGGVALVGVCRYQWLASYNLRGLVVGPAGLTFYPMRENRFHPGVSEECRSVAWSDLRLPEYETELIPGYKGKSGHNHYRMYLRWSAGRALLWEGLELPRLTALWEWISEQAPGPVPDA